MLGLRTVLVSSCRKASSFCLPIAGLYRLAPPRLGGWGFRGHGTTSDWVLQNLPTPGQSPCIRCPAIANGSAPCGFSEPCLSYHHGLKRHKSKSSTITQRAEGWDALGQAVPLGSTARYEYPCLLALAGRPTHKASARQYGGEDSEVGL